MPTGLTGGDKFVIYGLLGFIAWELWQQNALIADPQARCDFVYANVTPNWVQQLAEQRLQQQGGA